MGILGSISEKLIGTRNQRLIKQLNKEVSLIGQLESEWRTLTDSDLQLKTKEFRKRLQKGEAINYLIPEAFATVREASRRILGMRHFDVQLLGGLILHRAKIAEMRTGEGKTLVATLPVYLNALVGRGVHVMTVNDYLAQRDADWMRPLYQFLGLTVGVIKAGLILPERKKAYSADVTYGTNSEYGFDYLRDNMVLSVSEKVQRFLHYALVDEVDSILIDEARTPLIISGPVEEGSQYYGLVNQIVSQLKKGELADFTIDEKKRDVSLTEQGHQRLEEQFVRLGLLKEGENLYSAEHINLMYHVSAALQAHCIFKRDVDYIVRADQVIMVDEHTGRLMPGRRWSDGIHQAVEAKEKVAIHPESQTLASIALQNYLRLYSKLAGMTGTADTEAYEFQQTYKLEVVVVPTHQPVQRKDLPDKVYLTANEKWEAVVDAICDCWQHKQPVLVGTASIEHSEHLSRLLQNRGTPHQVLNAKRHGQEANIIAEAGRPGAVTIATNMAGRGTDIVLGGNLKAELANLDPNELRDIEERRMAWEERCKAVVAVGGLHIIGSERHESRRIDNQLRGRAGRQGDPGSSQFFLSLEDDLLRIFAAEQWIGTMQRLGMQYRESIENAWVTSAIQKAQRKVEAGNFDKRKALLEYDDVMNEQRKIIYQQRQALLLTDNIKETIHFLIGEVTQLLVKKYKVGKAGLDTLKLTKALERDFAVSLSFGGCSPELSEQLVGEIRTALLERYEVKKGELGVAVLRQTEKMVMLQVMDQLWRDHLAVVEYLRKAIHLRGYAQKNPIQEYKREAFMLFEQLLEALQYEVVSILSRLDNRVLPEPVASKPSLDMPVSIVGRNVPCTCGSGRKFKHCHGRLE